jgi:uncharacterized membrane protein YjgN (DUF898 family)
MTGHDDDRQTPPEPGHAGRGQSLMGGANAASGPIHSLSYDGRAGRIFAIWLLNLALNVVTIGIYSFWGKTRIRRYLARSFTLSGDRFEYTGTGKELFFGFLKALPLIIAVYAPLVIWPPDLYPVTKFIFILIVYLFSVAIYAALRYRLTRTQWRGIRGYLGGSAFRYGFIVMGYGLLNILTLGLLIPVSDRATLTYKMGNVWFGNVQGRFDPGSRSLWSSHLITWFLALPTLGISRIWYAAAVFRYQMNSFSIAGIRLRAEPTGGQLSWLLFGNFLIVVFTLGLGTPFTIQRNMNYVARHVAFDGDIAAAAARIQQSNEELGSSGEGLEGALGVDSGIF